MWAFFFLFLLLCPLMWAHRTAFDHSYQAHTRRNKAPDKGGETEVKTLAPLICGILIHTYSSYRPRPLILIGTLRVDEHTGAQTHSFIIQSAPELSTWINKPPPPLSHNAKLDKRSHRGLDGGSCQHLYLEFFLPHTETESCFFPFPLRSVLLVFDPPESRFLPLSACVRRKRPPPPLPPRHPYMIPLSGLSAAPGAVSFSGW